VSARTAASAMRLSSLKSSDRSLKSAGVTLNSCRNCTMSIASVARARTASLVCEAMQDRL